MITTKTNEEDTMTKKHPYRHGDVDIIPVKRREQLELSEELDSKILAYGEATGHHHLLTPAPGTKIAMMKCFDGKTYDRMIFKVSGGPATLTHPEHQTLSIDPGTYEISIEKEFDYFENETRKVLD